MSAYREVPQPSRVLPFEVVYGRRVGGPLDVLKENRVAAEATTTSSIISYVLQMRGELDGDRETVKEHVKLNVSRRCGTTRVLERESQPYRFTYRIVPVTTVSSLTSRLPDLSEPEGSSCDM